MRCPLNGHQAGACRGLCEPSPEGDGLCGRLAAHALIGRTQAAIAAQQSEPSEDAQLDAEYLEFLRAREREEAGEADPDDGDSDRAERRS